MHPYLPHLLSDISEAHHIVVPGENLSEQSFEDYIEDVERYLAGDEAKHTFGYYCGLKSLDFPPAEQFSNNELKQVCDAFEKLAQSWNIGIDLPKNLPLPFRYQLMVGLLEEKFHPPKQGAVHFDFCTGYAPDCDLKD